MKNNNPDEKLSELEREWRVANYERGAAWERFRTSKYNQRLVENYQTTQERCALIAERIIRYKQHYSL